MPDPTLESVIVRQLNDLCDQLQAMERRFDKRLDRIETHTAQTNGRVTKLELARARFEGATGVVKWLPPLVTAAAGSGMGALIALLVH